MINWNSSTPANEWHLWSFRRWRVRPASCPRPVCRFRLHAQCNVDWPTAAHSQVQRWIGCNLISVPVDLSSNGDPALLITPDTGVPQGSALRPRLLSMYIAPLAALIRSFGVLYHQCHFYFRLMAASFDFRHTQTSDSIPTSLSVLLHPENMGIAVGISFLSCI